MTEQIFQFAEKIREDSSLSEYESVDLAIKMSALAYHGMTNEILEKTNDMLYKINENLSNISRNIQRRI